MFQFRTRKLAVTLWIAVALLSSGCIKVQLTVQMKEDGSGLVVEEVVFGEKLVDAAKQLKNVPTIEELTSDEHLKRRASRMGKGVSFVGKKVEKQPDGSISLRATYAFQDISDLALAPLPFGSGWENLQRAFNLRADATHAGEYFLNMRLLHPNRKERTQSEMKASFPPLSEREAQEIRQLLPVFKDLLDGFELKLRLEIYDASKWATTTRGHKTSTHLNPLTGSGGRLTVFHLTDKHLNTSDDGLMLVVPWRQLGREADLCQIRFAGPGLQLLPHVNMIGAHGGFSFYWRALQTPRGREYY